MITAVAGMTADANILINYARQLRDELVKVGVPVPDGPGGIDLDDPVHDQP